MPRPHKCRKIFSNPDVVFFKPAGIMMQKLEEVILTLDEFEAVRLADYEDLYQEKAAEKMNISRQTFVNIINSAHKKIADFLINAKALQINGGVIELQKEEERHFLCYECKDVFNVPFGIPRPAQCPKCGSSNVHRSDDERGRGRHSCRQYKKGVKKGEKI
ncbi:MAG: DUF134 domain-containing protein [bacterium]